jgi:hypothetical protein
MLKGILHNKIYEAMSQYQKIKNIESLDISPTDQERLNICEDKLVNIIEQICGYQKKKTSTSFYTYSDSDGIVHAVNAVDNNIDKFLRDISYRIAFGDCSRETVLSIYWEGHELYYVGWQPGMKFEYVDSNKTTVWSQDFPQWDH